LAIAAQPPQPLPAGPVPKISCLMVTKGELFPARFAVQCYRRQTYPNRELVVVCDRPDNEVKRWIEHINDPTIRYIETGKAVLGALRNISVAAAEGELVCQWDDDDLYHPRRLGFQYMQLARSGKAAHFLSRWIIWWPKRRLIGISNERIWEGSMLVRKDLLPTYPEQALSEDTHVVVGLCRKHKIEVSRKPSLYCYIVHGNNSWHTQHFETMFKMADRIVRAERYQSQVDELAKVMPVKAYAANIDKAHDTYSVAD
jgi:glycosyltransferase involved in cell wall biosynthesis